MKRQLLIFMILALCVGCSRLLGGARKDSDLREVSLGETSGVNNGWSDHGFLSDGWGQGRALAGDSYINEVEKVKTVQDSNSSEGEFQESRKNYKSGFRATRADFLDESMNEGSLWASDGQTNYFFTKNKVRGVGDIVTITIEPNLIRDFTGEVLRTLTSVEKNEELNLAQQRIKEKYYAQGGSAGSTVATETNTGSRTPATTTSSLIKKDEEEYQGPIATMADVDLSKSLEIKQGDTVLAEIIRRYPNGNYKVRGTKRIPYREGFRNLTVIGVVKSSDISEEDVLGTGKLYEYQVEAGR